MLQYIIHVFIDMHIQALVKNGSMEYLFSENFFLNSFYIILLWTLSHILFIQFAPVMRYQVFIFYYIFYMRQSNPQLVWYGCFFHHSSVDEHFMSSPVFIVENGATMSIFLYLYQHMCRVHSQKGNFWILPFIFIE